nr:MerR family transcriptional regulator [uncultured Schaedlerella sp.]
MLISKFSKAAGISAYTLRYYEKKGLIRVNRDSAGRRDYSEDDIEWARFIKRLKDTGMLLRDIRHYSDLRYEGDSTMEERMALLLRHREAVVEQQKKWDGYLKNLDEKIHIYQKRITSPSQTSSSAPQHRPD